MRPRGRALWRLQFEHRAGASVARRNACGTTAEDHCARLSRSTDLLPDGVVNGFNRWLVVRSWSDEAHAVHNLFRGSRATVGELGGSKVLRPLIRMIPFLRRYDRLRAEYVTASEHVSRLQEHNRLLTVAVVHNFGRS